MYFPRAGIGLCLKPSLDLHRDRPDEAEQLSSYCRHHLVLVLPSRRQLLIPRVQPLLSFPGDLFGFLAEFEIPLAFQEVSTQPWPMLVGPGRFNNHSAQVGVPGLGDPSALNAIAAGMFARDQAAVAHQLPRLEARETADLGDDRYRRELSNAAQCLQCFDYGSQLRRRLSDCLVN